MARKVRFLTNGGALVLMLWCGCSGSAASTDAGVGDADGGGVRFDGDVLDSASGGDGDVLDGASAGGDGAISDGSTIPQDAAFAVDQLARFNDICIEWGDIICNAIETCCTPAERPRTLAECLSSQDVGCHLMFSGEAFLDGRISFDLTAAAAFNADLRTRAAACDPTAGDGIAKFLAGNVPVGGDCTPIDLHIGVGRDASALLSCAPGLYCGITTDATGHHGVCRTMGLAGEACTAPNECRFESGLTCDLATGHDHVCVALFSDGTACTSRSSCAGGYCDMSLCTSTPHVPWCA